MHLSLVFFFIVLFILNKTIWGTKLAILHLLQEMQPFGVQLDSFVKHLHRGHNILETTGNISQEIMLNFLDLSYQPNPVQFS